ncbi:MAG: S8 family serine peptidase [Clostridiales bacterium]|nr:S8 family serine peptidase [Clostridiales bacterium]
MRKYMFVLTVIAVVLYINVSVYADSGGYSGYIVKIKDSYISRSRSADIENTYGFFTVDSMEEAENYIELGIAEYAEPNYEVSLLSIPDDELFSDQWHHEMISSEDAWNLEFYGEGIRVAVIDSGCYEHDDIKNNLQEGYNYFEDNTDVADNISHGTHVCGIIAAEMNSIGTVGIACKAEIVPLKCFESGEITLVSDILEAIYDAVDVYDCQIINMSWGLEDYSAALEEAVTYATEKNIIMTAAAGNNGNADTYYPAAFDDVIGIGSVSAAGKISSFSQRNSGVFAVAPGESILSLSSDGSYAYKSGTSQSAPIAAGLAAVLLSIDGSLTPNDFKQCLIDSSEDLGESGYDTYYGYGLINTGRAVRYVLGGEDYYISEINYDSGKINFGVWNNTDEELTGVIITGAYYDLYAENIDISEINIASDAIQAFEFYYSGNYDILKCFIWDSLENMRSIGKVRTLE